MSAAQRLRSCPTDEVRGSRMQGELVRDGGSWCGPQRSEDTVRLTDTGGLAWREGSALSESVERAASDYTLRVQRALMGVGLRQVCAGR